MQSAHGLASDRDRVGQSQPGPDSATPGKSPRHTTGHLVSEPSTRSGREPLAVLKADPRSCLAALSRPPSVPPCGFPSGFPRSHLAVLARGSALTLNSVIPSLARVELFGCSFVQASPGALLIINDGHPGLRPRDQVGSLHEAGKASTCEWTAYR